MKISYRNFPFLQVFDKGTFKAYKCNSDSFGVDDCCLKNLYILRNLYANRGTFLGSPIYVVSDEFQQMTMKNAAKLIDNFVCDNSVMKEILKPCCFIYKMIVWTLFVNDDKYTIISQSKSGRIWFWFEFRFTEQEGIAKHPDGIHFNVSEFDSKGLFGGFLALLLAKRYAPVEVEIVGSWKKTISSVSKEKTVNDTGIDVTLLDSRWFKTIIRTEGFTVRGHFRLQPYKNEAGLWDRKLIYIDEFEKHGYHRAAKLDSVIETMI